MNAVLPFRPARSCGRAWGAARYQIACHRGLSTAMSGFVVKDDPAHSAYRTHPVRCILGLRSLCECVI